MTTVSIKYLCRESFTDRITHNAGSGYRSPSENGLSYKRKLFREKLARATRGYFENSAPGTTRLEKAQNIQIDGK
jgi:hypothetical protein